MFFTYILFSEKDHRTYVGFCQDIAIRLKNHNSGLVKSTKHRRPFKLFYLEKHPTITEAKSREKYWKSGAGRRQLKILYETNK
ncbi:MAG: GIY-YIG nuclease family protein [Patescibacteria group bacterium]|jgi:putative endonuclease